MNSFEVLEGQGRGKEERGEVGGEERRGGEEGTKVPKQTLYQAWVLKRAGVTAFAFLLCFVFETASGVTSNAYSPCWPWPTDPLTTFSRVLTLQACTTTMPSLCKNPGLPCKLGKDSPMAPHPQPPANAFCFPLKTTQSTPPPNAKHFFV